MTNQKRVRKTPEERRADVHGAVVGEPAGDRDQQPSGQFDALQHRGVGVAPALITHYVSRMELLVAEVFRDIAQEELASVRATVEAVEGDEVEQVLTLLRELIHDFRRDVALVWLDGWSLSRRNDELAGVLVEEARAWEEFVAGIFARGDAAGAFSAPEPLALARFVVGATDGLSAQSAVWAGYEDETARYVVETVAALLRIPAGDAPRTTSY